MMIFHKNLRKFAEIIKKICCKISENLSEKMYTLNRYGGYTQRFMAAPLEPGDPRIVLSTARPAYAALHGSSPRTRRSRRSSAPS